MNKLTPDVIKHVVCKYYEISPSIDTNKRRYSEIIRARHACMYMIRKNIPKVTLIDTAKMFNLTNHSTVVYIEKRINGLLDFDKQITKEYREIQALIDRLRIPEGKDFIKYCILGRSIN